MLSRGSPVARSLRASTRMAPVDLHDPLETSPSYSKYSVGSAHSSPKSTQVLGDISSISNVLKDSTKRDASLACESGIVGLPGDSGEVLPQNVDNIDSTTASKPLSWRLIPCDHGRSRKRRRRDLMGDVDESTTEVTMIQPGLEDQPEGSETLVCPVTGHEMSVNITRKVAPVGIPKNAYGDQRGVGCWDCMNALSHCSMRFNHFSCRFT